MSLPSHRALPALLICLLLLFSAHNLAAQAATDDASSPSEVRPRDEEAKAIFLAGRAALEGGHFEDALKHFQSAFALSGRPELLFNIGTALDRLRRDAEAARYFELYLEALPQAENHASVAGRIARLREQQTAQAHTKAIPSPSEAARAALEAPTVGVEAESPKHVEASPSPRKKRWLWATLGMAVAAGAVATVLLVRKDDAVRESPLLGSQGAVVQALWSP